MNRRVIVLFIIGLLILAALGGLLFYLSGKQQEDMQDLQTTLQIRKVLDEAVISPAAAYDNNSIWYFNSEGRLFKSNTDGSNLSEYPLPSLPSGSLKQVLWPKAGSDFIAVANSSGQTAKYYYNSANKVFTNLANNIQWVDWLPDGKRIAYIWQSDDKKTQSLVVSNADGTGFKTVTPVFWPDLALKASPDGKTVLMYRTNIVGDVNKIYAANLETGQVITLVDTGKSTSAKWLESGNFIFAKDSKIYYFDVLNKTATDLKISTSLDKVSVDSVSKNLYAAIPNSENTSDSFIKINLVNHASENYFSPSSDIRVKNTMLVGNTVYYIDARDNKLYMLSR